MLKLNLFSVLRSLDKINKDKVREIVESLSKKMPANAENYIYLRVVSQIMEEVSATMKDTLIEQGKVDFKGVKLATRTTTPKIFNDKELKDLQEEATKVDAKIKARKAYLVALKDFSDGESSTTLAMTIP